MTPGELVGIYEEAGLAWQELGFSLRLLCATPPAQRGGILTQCELRFAEFRPLIFQLEKGLKLDIKGR